ncbi:MAG: CDP-alcohol phosphatidyltransferase family protein [Myxococcota bacterium]|jgi:phosphatidylglycerophosphate synthase|nr:CDP-alcohol phosphatidyltransferase family protein [Myxococcota bacterium]
MTMTSDHPSSPAGLPPTQHPEAQRAGLLPASAVRDASERDGGRYLILDESPIEVWRRPMSHRLERQLAAEGLGPYGEGDVDATSPVAILRADHFFDRAAGYLLLRDAPSLMTMPGPSGGVVPVAAYCNADEVDTWRALLEAGEVDAASLPAEASMLDAAALPEIYNSELRKMTRPFVSAINENTIDEIERRTFDLAYKGVTDFVTKYIYPTPAYYGTRLAAHLGLSPNALTSISLVLVVITTWLFATGQHALGLPFGFLMSYFDTLDGKLARVTQTSTKWGDTFDHAIDLVHPPFWWFAWWWGVGLQSAPAGWSLAAILTFVFYTLVRLLEWRFKKRYAVRIHTWQPFDSHFRSITTRRNPNLTILTLSLLFADAAFGVYAVLGWMMISFAIHTTRFIQAEIQVRGGTPLRSWFEKI